jgi:predicted nucleotide-binding protein
LATRTPPRTPQPARLTSEDKRAGIGKLEKRLRDLRAFEVKSLKESTSPALTALEHAVQATLADIFGSDTTDASRYRSAGQLRHYPVLSFSMNRGQTGPSIGEIHRDVAAHIENAIAMIEGIVARFREDLEEDDGGGAEARAEVRAESTRRVFVVHGHDQGTKETVARFLSQLDLEPIILHEQPSGGRTIIEKFEDYSDVAFAVVVLTPDDHGGPAGAITQARARQNVILELGFFLGRLGRARVCALKKGEVEVPTDFAGVVYTTIDDAGGWKVELAKEISASGIEIDFNKVFKK